MAVVIGLSRRGQNKLPFYRIVVKEKGTKRDGKFIEILGTYDSLKDPGVITFKEERLKYWIEQGAQPTRIVSDLIKKAYPKYLEEILEGRTKKVQLKRQKRKQRATKAAA